LVPFEPLGPLVPFEPLVLSPGEVYVPGVDTLLAPLLVPI
jgi:hypothetical protein